MAAYVYHVVNEYQSSHDDETWYTVCIREDTRIGNLDERRQRAILTCSCRGWILHCPGGKDENRSCRHTKAEAAALAKFKRGASQTTQPQSQPQPIVLDEAPKVYKGRGGRWRALRPMTE